MRKPRDYDAELKALDDKARQLKDRKVRQLGELVIACRADELSMEELAGALLNAAHTDDNTAKEEWRKRGAAFFQRPARRPAARTGRSTSGSEASGGSAKPAAGEAGAE